MPQEPCGDEIFLLNSRSLSLSLSLPFPISFSLSMSYLPFNEIHTVDFGVWSHSQLSSGRGISYNQIITPAEASNIVSVLCQEFCP